MAPKEIDKLLDHDADGIKEFDNALPRWWLYGFYFTIVMSVIYMFYYHVYGGSDWNFLWYGPRGQVAEYTAEVDAAKAANKSAGGGANFSAPMTEQAALDAGKAIFEGTNNACFTCHRNDLGGQVGPNLTDDYWIHGNKFQDVVNSIKSGFPDKGMQPFGTGAKLTDEQTAQLASYIISKHGTHPADPKPIDPEREKLIEEGHAQEIQEHAK